MNTIRKPVDKIHMMHGIHLISHKEPDLLLGSFRKDNQLDKFFKKSLADSPILSIRSSYPVTAFARDSFINRVKQWKDGSLISYDFGRCILINEPDKWNPLTDSIIMELKRRNITGVIDRMCVTYLLFQHIASLLSVKFDYSRAFDMFCRHQLKEYPAQWVDFAETVRKYPFGSRAETNLLFFDDHADIVQKYVYNILTHGFYSTKSSGIRKFIVKKAITDPIYAEFRMFEETMPINVDLSA